MSGLSQAEKLELSMASTDSLGASTSQETTNLTGAPDEARSGQEAGEEEGEEDEESKVYRELPTSLFKKGLAWLLTIVPESDEPDSHEQTMAETETKSGANPEAATGPEAPSESKSQEHDRKHEQEYEDVLLEGWADILEVTHTWCNTCAYC